MGTWKVRLFALLLTAIGVGMVYMNWQEALTKGTYDLRLAAFGPLIVVGGIFLLFFLRKVGHPETAMDKIIVKWHNFNNLRNNRFGKQHGHE